MSYRVVSCRTGRFDVDDDDDESTRKRRAILGRNTQKARGIQSGNQSCAVNEPRHHRIKYLVQYRHHHHIDNKAIIHHHHRRHHHYIYIIIE